MSLLYKLDYTSDLKATIKIMDERENNTPVVGSGIWGKVLSIILAVIILAGVVALCYSAAVPFKEPFTEFYILDMNGKAEDYPDEMVVGEEAELLVGIVNREYKTMAYRVEVQVDGTISDEIEQIVKERTPIYQQCAEYTIITDGKELHQLLIEIVTLLENKMH